MCRFVGMWFKITEISKRKIHLHQQEFGLLCLIRWYEVAKNEITSMKFWQVERMFHRLIVCCCIIFVYSAFCQINTKQCRMSNALCIVVYVIHFVFVNGWSDVFVFVHTQYKRQILWQRLLFQTKSMYECRCKILSSQNMGDRKKHE